MRKSIAMPSVELSVLSALRNALISAYIFSRVASSVLSGSKRRYASDSSPSSLNRFLTTNAAVSSLRW